MLYAILTDVAIPSSTVFSDIGAIAGLVILAVALAAGGFVLGYRLIKGKKSKENK